MVAEEAEADPSLVGLIFGQCELLDQVASGGSATIYRGWHPRLGKDVAVKVLHARRLTDRDALARFLREPKIQARVADHANVVRILDAGEAPDAAGRARPYIVMELLHGATLAHHLAGHGKMTEENAVEMAVAILGALKHLHRVGLVHRDLKPSNIYLHRDPAGRLVVKVLDWGIARETAAGFTTEHVVLGTRGYLAPEQASGVPVDAACDLFQLGLVLFEAITGERVLDESASPKKPAKAIREALARPALEGRQALRDLLRRMLQVEPIGVHAWPMSNPQSMDFAGSGRRSPAHTAVIDEDTIRNTVGEVFEGRSKRRKRALTVGIVAAAAVAFMSGAAGHHYEQARAREFLTPMKHLDGAAHWTGGRTDLERASMAQMKQLSDLREAEARTSGAARGEDSAPFDLDVNDVTWQQIADWVNLLWFFHVDTEIDSSVNRWIKDRPGRKLLDLNDEAPELVRVWGRFVPREGYAWRAADGIPFETANAYCEYFGKRLPTADEFEYAYRGDSDRWFPWGNKVPDSRADCDRALFDTDPEAEGRTAQCAKPGTRAIAGDVRDEDRDIVNGIQGLMGNVSEWTSTEWVEPNDPDIGGKSAHVLRGGNYLAPFALGISTMRQRFADDEMLSGNGFRCAR